MSKVKAVAVAIGLMLCASVGHAQTQSAFFPQQSGVAFSSPPSTALPANFTCPVTKASTANCGVQKSEAPQMYVACRADVPSHNTAYFSATFAAPTVNGVRKEFRQFVTTQYGPVSKVQCAGKFSENVVNEQVEKWKDSARTTKNAIVDT